MNPKSIIADRFGRQFSYLRLSITDACNFRCGYCLPNGYKKPEDSVEPLTLPEITRLVTVFAELGTTKIRLTGGEPTLRRDLLEIVKAIKKINGIQKIALSTNGFRLKEMALTLKEVGVQALNISVDTLNPEKFEEITGKNYLPQILEGIEKALDLGFEKIKLNAVLLGGKNDSDETLTEFKNWIKTRPVAIRFIELMPNATIPKYFSEHHKLSAPLREKFLNQGWSLQSRGATDGPAEEFAHPEYRGRLGLIAPYRKDFCATCNRLRVTSQGKLRLCLFAEGEQSLRQWLQHDNQREELKMHLLEMIGRKEISHYLPDGNYGDNRTFSAIGG
jgi:cyclic pyranopterin phosphate synthase